MYLWSDSGATAFLPFWTYIVESEMIRVLREAGRKVYLHVPVTGERCSTTRSSDSLRWQSNHRPQRYRLAQYEYFGPLRTEAKGSKKCKAYSDIRIRS